MMGEVEVAFVGSWGMVCPMESVWCGISCSEAMGWRDISCSEESSDANAVELTGSVDAMESPGSDANGRVSGSCSVGVNDNAGGAGVKTRVEGDEEDGEQVPGPLVSAIDSLNLFFNQTASSDVVSL